MFARPSPDQQRSRRQAEKAANLSALATPSRTLHRAAIARFDVAAKPIEKRQKLGKGVAERRHKARLVLLGCMACRRIHGPHEPGPVELHHLRMGGWGKGDYTTLIPLCPDHHRGPLGVHGLGTKGFPAHYGFDQADLLAEAWQLVNGEG